MNVKPSCGESAKGRPPGAQVEITFGEARGWILARGWLGALLRY